MVKWTKTQPATLIGPALLVLGVLFSAWYAAPELRIGRVPVNDVVSHLVASERLATAFERGEPFLDAWVSEWSLGYPYWLSYQPLPHAAAALVLRIFRGLDEPAAIFAGLMYLLIVTFPASVYAGARLFGLSPPAAGLAALLSWAPSAGGFGGGYGLGYGALLWRGSGLYNQLFALHLMVLALGLSARALDGGERRDRVLASLLLALTALAHIIFGYAAFVSAGLLALVGPRGRRTERLARLTTIAAPALLLLAWFLVPLLLSREVVNHSRWEDPRKWDSYGAPVILRELLSGRLFDYGRPPVLSVLLGAGAFAAILSRADALARRLLLLCGWWLALFFGRPTWGPLLLLAGVPADLHLHRLQAVFEVSAVLLGAYGLTRCLGWAAERRRAFAVAGGVILALALVPIVRERARFLDENRAWGEQNLASYQGERRDLEAALDNVQAILNERPGRVSAGLAARWGGQFKVGSAHVFSFLSRRHIDQTSFLYHSMSKSSDVMVVRDENSRVHDTVFGIRAVLAPFHLSMPGHLRRRSVHGRFAVYESSPEGYFGIADVAGHYVGPSSTYYEVSTSWLNSPLPGAGIVIALDPRAGIGPAIPRWEALPAAAATPRGGVVSETKTGETYQARIAVHRPAYALLKITWNPKLQATVDGRPTPVLHVTPGFCAVAVPAGVHDVAVEYRPGLLKPALFGVGLAGFVLAWFVPGTSTRRALRIPFRGTLVVAGLVLAAYVWTATSGGKPVRLERAPNPSLYSWPQWYHNLQAESFLAGQLHLLIQPSKELLALPDPYDPQQNRAYRLHDAILYGGKYYLSWGPTPALLVYLPFRVVFGRYLPDNLAAMLFCFGGFLFSAGLLRHLQRRFLPATPPWMALAGMAALGFCNGALWILRRPIVYEVAVACLYCMLAAAAYLMVTGLLREPVSLARLAAGSLSLGLGAGARAPLLFGVVLPAVLAWRLRRAPRRIPMLACLFGPFLACVFLLGLFNYLRFGSWTDFGVQYSLTHFENMRKYQTFVAARIPLGFYYFLCEPHLLSGEFPFWRLAPKPHWTFPQYYYLGPIAGILPAVPILNLLWLVPFVFRALRRSLSDLLLVMLSLLALAFTLLLVITAVNVPTMRYQIYFATPFMLVALLLWFFLDGRMGGWVGHLARAGAVALLGYGFLFHIFVSFTGEDETFRRNDPETYRSIQAVFDWIPRRLPGSAAAPGPVWMRVQFPAAGGGRAEPLVVTGVPGAGDFVFVRYLLPGFVQFGLDHWGQAPLLSPPVKVVPGADAQLEIHLGTQSRRTFRTMLDGTEVLRGESDFYPSENSQVTIGENRIGGTICGPRFTGRILETRRLPAPRD